MINIENLRISKIDNILDNINLAINKGDVVCLIGQNGVGKSTLLKAIMGFNNIYDIQGTIKFNNTDISNYSIDERARLGMFLSMQDPIEIPGIKLLDFYRMIYQAKYQKVNVLDLYKKVETILKQVNLNQDFLNRGINENFSGGEKKKNEIIQMLLLEPEVIMLDEIDSGLDFDTLNLINDIIKQEIKKEKTIIFISHHLQTIKALNPNKVILIADHHIVTISDMSLVDKINQYGYKKVLKEFGIEEKKELLETCFTKEKYHGK